VYKKIVRERYFFGAIVNLSDDKISELYEDGLSCHAIAKIDKSSQTTIYNRLINIGVKIRSKSEANKIFPDIIFVRLYNLGLSSSQIGRLLGVDSSTVTKRLQSINYPLRSRTHALNIRYTEDEFKRIDKLLTVAFDKLILGHVAIRTPSLNKNFLFTFLYFLNEKYPELKILKDDKEKIRNMINKVGKLTKEKFGASCTEDVFNKIYTALDIEYKDIFIINIDEESDDEFDLSGAAKRKLERLDRKKKKKRRTKKSKDA